MAVPTAKGTRYVTTTCALGIQVSSETSKQPPFAQEANPSARISASLMLAQHEARMQQYGQLTPQS
jgi:hypothetical protein